MLYFKYFPSPINQSVTMKQLVTFRAGRNEKDATKTFLTCQKKTK